MNIRALFKSVRIDKDTKILLYLLYNLAMCENIEFAIFEQSL